MSEAIAIAEAIRIARNLRDEGMSGIVAGIIEGRWRLLSRARRCAAGTG